MANMEFLSSNLINTTTMFVVDSNIDSVGYLIDRNPNLQYFTVGYTSDTSTVISVELGNQYNINNVIIQNHNLKSFRVFYDSTTANSLFVTATNSDTNTYISFATTAVQSIQIQIDEAQSDGEREIGQIIVTSRKVQFDRNPSAEDYLPVLKRQQIKHYMPDGGVQVFRIANKFKADMRFRFHSSDFYEDLAALYGESDPFYFLPFPTTTAWAGAAYEVAWTNDFNFRHSDNAKTQGYDGNIVIEQTANS